MKLKDILAIKIVILTLGVCAATASPAFAIDEGLPSKGEPIVVLLVDPEDPQEVPSSGDPTMEPNQPSLPETGTIEDLIEQVRQERLTLNEYEQRVLTLVEREQAGFVKSLETFLSANFVKEDPSSDESFAKSAEQIVKLVFKSPTDRAFYSRIYLINKLWLEHQTQKLRFDYLDKALQTESLRIESRNRKIRQGLIGITTVTGLGIGAYLGYKAAYSIVKVAANEKGLASISKMALRTGIIVVTATTGAAAGSFAGYLGSDLMLNNSRELLDPIDGDEHLKELLEYIDDLQE